MYMYINLRLYYHNIPYGLYMYPLSQVLTPIIMSEHPSWPGK